MAQVWAFLAAGADVNAAEPDGATALHWVSYHDEIETLDRLLAGGADANAVNDLGVSALWTASENGSTDAVSRLLEAGADPNLALLAGETPVMVAARSGAAKVVELLLRAGANPEARGTRGQTALMWAVAQQHPSVVQVLIDSGVDLHARSEVWSQVMAVPPHGQPEYNREIPHGGNTALMFAARGGDVASARLLLAAGANADDTNAWGVSATTLAAHAGFGELVTLLLEAGADAGASEAGFAALHAAVMRRDPLMVRTLLEHGADPNATLNTWTPTRRSSRDLHFAPPLVGATPFWLAARFNAPDVMLLLADHGADPRVIHHADYKDPGYAQPRQEATTAVMAAIGMGGGRLRSWKPPNRLELESLRLDTVRVAVELGADVDATDLFGLTVIDQARSVGFDAVVAFLESHSAASP